MQGGSCRTVMMEGNGAGSLGGLWVCGCTGRLTVGPPRKFGGGWPGWEPNFCRCGAAFAGVVLPFGGGSALTLSQILLRMIFLINLSSFYLNIART
jgi:hypothetical protein